MIETKRDFFIHGLLIKITLNGSILREYIELHLKEPWINQELFTFSYVLW